MKRTILSLFLLAAALFTLTACNQNEGEETTEERITPVETARVEQGDFIIDRKIAGRAAPGESSPVLPSIPGELVTLNVAKGDRIEKGQTVGVVNPGDQGNQVELQEVSVRQAEAQLENAQTQYDQAVEGVNMAEEQLELIRESAGTQSTQTALEEQVNSAQQLADEAKKLADKGSVPQSIYEQAKSRADQAQKQFNQTLDQAGATASAQASQAEAQAEAQLKQAKQAVTQAEQAVEQAQLGLEQAQIQLDAARTQTENEAIIAPRTGEVTTLEASEGDDVTNQQPFATITSLNPMTIVASVTSNQLSLFEKGEELEVEIEGETFTSTIDYVPSIPDDTNLYPVEATISNDEENIKPGMMASFVLPETAVEGALIVPTDAITEQSGQSFVYRINGDTVKRVDIEVVESQTDRSAIEGDLSVDEEVVTSGQLTLEDGAKIEVMEKEEDE
ncbi:efflux RND transporter periplasmic adaptor subunit [Halobacillus sp. Marseille-Q1614]|uniref:efflux RND transporter periplasmic adaptor subunit n=1 Tax=Halobacillus sp. Marseille-Q1614 TaxID=2709134 RepID=UPI00156F830C|nr:efflux RND transporter periplasmic adaptor subunit [Halobacillus sp. Marseille-Q1614]